MIDPLVLTGRVVTFDEEQPEIDDGAVYVGADELIAAVRPRSAPAPPGFDGAREVRTGERGPLPAVVPPPERRD